MSFVSLSLILLKIYKFSLRLYFKPLPHFFCGIYSGQYGGIDYIRIKLSSVANPRTVGQVNQRTKFTTTLEFLRAIKPFIKLGYKGLAVKKTEFNAAISYVLNNAITGTEPNFVVDYPNALVSREVYLVR